MRRESKVVVVGRLVTGKDGKKDLRPCERLKDRETLHRECLAAGDPGYCRMDAETESVFHGMPVLMPNGDVVMFVNPPASVAPREGSLELAHA